MAPVRSTGEELRTAGLQSAAARPENGKLEKAKVARRSSSNLRTALPCSQIGAVNHLLPQALF